MHKISIFCFPITYLDLGFLYFFLKILICRFFALHLPCRRRQFVIPTRLLCVCIVNSIWIRPIPFRGDRHISHLFAYGTHTHAAHSHSFMPETCINMNMVFLFDCALLFVRPLSPNLCSLYLRLSYTQRKAKKTCRVEKKNLRQNPKTVTKFMSRIKIMSTCAT